MENLCVNWLYIQRKEKHNMNLPRITQYQRCNCGAITLWFEGNRIGNAMYQDTFDKLGLDLSGAEQLPNSYCCDHCVNHWGIDLCECGSGERVGECDCGCNNARYELGEDFDSFSLVLDAFGIKR